MFQRSNAARLSLVSAVFMAVLSVASTARADDGQGRIDDAVCRTYPRRPADFKNWLKREMVPGHIGIDEALAVFGKKFYHVEGDREGNVHLLCGLDELGFANAPHEVLWLVFDERTGSLVRVAVEEERSTGYHITGAP